MKIQNLAVIFIIIILPISLILTSYVQNQVKTLGLQVSYDTKLNNATYDALKAFQLNTFNSDTSDLSNSKMRDVEASANTFFTSIASNFNSILIYILLIGILFCNVCTKFKTSFKLEVRYPIRNKQTAKRTSVLYSGLNCFVTIASIAPAIPISAILKTSILSSPIIEKGCISL